MSFEKGQSKMQRFLVLNAIVSSIAKGNRHAEMNMELWNRKRTFQSKIRFPQPEKKHHPDGWRCTKSGNSWRLSLNDKFFVLLRVVWCTKQRPTYRQTIAEDLLVLTVFAVNIERKLQKVFTARSDTLFTNFIDSNSVFPPGRSKPRKQRWI